MHSLEDKKSDWLLFSATSIVRSLKQKKKKKKIKDGGSYFVEENDSEC